MFYIKIEKGRLTKSQATKLKPKLTKGLNAKSKDITRVPLKNCKNMKSAIKKARKLTSWKVSEESLNIKNLKDMTFIVVEVVNG